MLSYSVRYIFGINQRKSFMEKFILSFGMVAVVVVDADKKILKVFEAMCTSLKLNFGPLARNNHTGLSFEGYHILFNKTQTIVSQDQGTHQSFLENHTKSQYAWNSAPIYDTNIPPFRFRSGP